MASEWQNILLRARRFKCYAFRMLFCISNVLCAKTGNAKTEIFKAIFGQKMSSKNDFMNNLINAMKHALLIH